MCSVPRKTGGTGKHTVRGVLGVSPSSTVGTYLHVGGLGSTSFYHSRGIIFYAGGNIVGGAYLARCSHPHAGNIGTVAVHRSSHIVRIHLAGKSGRVIITGQGNHTVHFRRDGIHTVKHATANMHNVTVSRSKVSRIMNVMYIGSPRARAVVMMDRRNCKGHSSVRSCHIAGHNTGNIGALGVASGANGLMTVGIIASRGSLVVVGGDNVAVHLGITSMHIVKHTARNIHLVGLRGHGSRVDDIYGIRARRIRRIRRDTRVIRIPRARTSLRDRRGAGRWSLVSVVVGGCVLSLVVLVSNIKIFTRGDLIGETRKCVHLGRLSGTRRAVARTLGDKGAGGLTGT